MSNLLLLLIAHTLLTVLSPLLITYGIIRSIFNGTFFTWLRDIAISIDRLGNVIGKYLFNDLLGIGFGNGKETISARLGYNKLLGTLKKLGIFICKCLNLLDKNHVENAVKKDR